MKQPYVTVLMTVYNGGKYLKPAVESVLSQSWHDFEFLIVNDASQDDSMVVLRSYHDPRIRIVDNPHNIGQTSSLNVGLREARGEYIARIDADDMALPGWLEAQVSCAQGHPESTIISLPVVLIDLFGRVTKFFSFSFSREEIYLRILTHSPISHGGSLIKRAAMLREGGYDENLKIAADYRLWSKFVCHGNLFISTDHVGMAVRIHGGSITARNKEQLRKELLLIWNENILELTEFLPRPVIWNFSGGCSRTWIIFP